MLLCNSKIIFRSFTAFYDFSFFFTKLQHGMNFHLGSFFKGLIIGMDESRIATGQHLVSSPIKLKGLGVALTHN